MAELVQYNMEQMLPFFKEMSEIIEDDVVKKVVSKRQQFEYKLASKHRNFNDFLNYIEYELTNYTFIKSVKKANVAPLLKTIKSLINRVLKQMSIHFQNEPRAFLCAIKVAQKFRDSTTEKSHWESLLKKHGQKNVKYYISAVHRAMHKMLPSDEKYADYRCDLVVKEKQTKLKSKRDPRAIEELQKEIEFEISKLRESKTELRYLNYDWARNIMIDATRDFPKNKLVYIEYLKFEINNYIFQQEAPEEMKKIYGECADGRVLVILLDQILEDFPETEYLRSIVNLMNDYVPAFECESLHRIYELLSESSQSMVVDEPNLMPQKVLATSNVDHYEHFLEKYPNPKYIRAMSPKTACDDLVAYLKVLTTKMLSGQLSRDSEMHKVRQLLDWILSDDDWSRGCLDLWWQYYEMERDCGEFMKSLTVIQKAEEKLNADMKTVLTIRKIKSQRQ